MTFNTDLAFGTPVNGSKVFAKMHVSFPWADPFSPSLQTWLPLGFMLHGTEGWIGGQWHMGMAKQLYLKALVIS